MFNFNKRYPIQDHKKYSLRVYSTVPRTVGYRNLWGKSARVVFGCAHEDEFEYLRVEFLDSNSKDQ